MTGNPDASGGIFDSAGLLRAAVVLSSESLGWGAISATCYSHPPAEVALPTLPEHVICLHLGRSVRVVERLDGATRERGVDRGEVLLAPPGCPNGEASWDARSEFLHVRLRPGFVRAVAASLEMPHPERVDAGEPLLVRSPRIEQIGLWLAEEMRIGGPGGRLMADSLADSLAVELCLAWGLPVRGTAEGRRRLRDSALRRAIDHIRADLDGDLSLAAIARVAGHSPYHFARKFRESTGTTPHQFVIRCRVEEAERLLLAGVGSIAAAAHRVGFVDQSHLTRHFKRLRGVTPARFLEQSGGRTRAGQDSPRRPPIEPYP